MKARATCELILRLVCISLHFYKLVTFKILLERKQIVRDDKITCKLGLRVLFIQKSCMGFIPQRLNIAILKRPQYQDCNQPLSLFIFENIIIIFCC